MSALLLPFGLNLQPTFGPTSGPGQYYGPFLVFGLNLGVAVSPYPDLLSALVDYLKTAGTLVPLLSGFGQNTFGSAPFGGEMQVWDELAPSYASPPFVVLRDYTEELPGPTLDDECVPVKIFVVTNDLDTARTIGQAVKDAIDHPNNSDTSLGRDPFVFEGGQETFLKRNTSKPRRVSGLTRDGLYLYREEIPYEFWTTPER